jgi:Immunoglobulin-like domain of bacterial spore germination
VRRILPLLALAAVAGCGDSGGSQSTTTTSTDMIVIESPARDEAVQSPFHVSGTANTFEATFILELRTGGHRLVRRVVTATSGSGSSGTFDVQLRFSVPEERRGELRAYELSAENGQPINTVTVPISLRP